MKYICLLIFGFLLTILSFGQTNILVVDYNNAFSSDQNNNSSIIYNRLVATQGTVNRVASIPATISTATYDQVWIFGNMGGPVAGNLNPIINYMNAGGAVYVQSEVSCCNNQAAYLDALINSTVTIGGSITHNTTYGDYYQYDMNSNVFCGSGSFSGYGAAIRPFTGTPAVNAFLTSNTSCGNPSRVIGVQFRNCDMISGNGALIGTGDFNIFPTTGGCSTVGILGNPNHNTLIDMIVSTLNNMKNCSFGSSTGSPAWTDPSPLCISDPSINLDNLVTGTPGGTWSGVGVSGNMFNPGAGTQTVTYTIGTSPCQSTQSHTITVNPQLDATITPAGPFCTNDPAVNLTAVDGGGDWSGTGITNTTSGTFDPNTAGVGTHVITYGIQGNCGDTQTVNITVDPSDDASFAYNPVSYCVTGANPLPSSITLNGGGFSISSPGVINPTTGEIDLMNSGVGTFWVYYNTSPLGNNCPSMDSIQITITTGLTAGFAYNGAQFCQDSIDPILTLSPGASSGSFSSSPTGLILNGTNGNVTLIGSTPGVYTVYNTVPPANGCAGVVDSTTIEVLQVDSALFSYANLTYCLSDTGDIANITGTTGGTFSISGGGVINPTTGQVNIGASGTGTFMVYYNTSSAGNPCPAEDSLQITIVSQNAINPSVPNAICLGDTITLTATASGAGTITWYSDPNGTTIIGTGSPIVVVPSQLGTTTYYVQETGSCPSPIDSIVVQVNGVSASIGANPLTGASPLNVSFSNSSTTGAGISYLWNFGTGDSSLTFQPSYTYNDEGVYVVVLMVTDGQCVAYDTLTITVIGESTIFIPNVFTPNGDGNNDVFKIDGTNLEKVACEIYNRWGQLMYSWDDVNGFWNGRTLAGKETPDGTYYFIANIVGGDGIEYHEKGTISLIR